jgi:hypothetical protein
MRWYLNPLTLFKAGRGLNQLRAGGGPASVRLRGVGRPAGWIVPAMPVALEIVTRDGSVIALDPEIPLPFGLGWGYRIANRLGVPFISDLDPSKIRTEVAVPGAGSAGP